MPSTRLAIGLIVTLTIAGTMGLALLAVNTGPLAASPWLPWLAVAGGSIAIVAVATRVVDWLLLRPLWQLTTAAERITLNGDPVTAARAGEPADVAVLAARLDALATDVEAQLAALRRLNATLEARVEERTQALRARTVAHRATELELEAARSCLAGASRERRAFVVMLAQEVRTPLDTIVSYAEMLREEADARGYTGATPSLARMATGGRLLLDLVDDILDLSKIEAGRLHFTREAFQPARVLADAVAAIRPLAEHRGNTLVLDVAPDLGDMWGDSVRVRQVLVGLLSSASASCERGTIGVSARRLRSDRQDYCDWLEVTIADSGPGLEAAQVEHFNAEADLDTSLGRTNGLEKLASRLSQHFARLMGGQVTMASAIGVGTVFTVSLPASGGDRRPQTRLETRAHTAREPGRQPGTPARA